MAYMTVRVEGYYTVEVPDDYSEFIMIEGNRRISEEDFGPLQDIEWRVISIEHDDGRYQEYA